MVNDTFDSILYHEGDGCAGGIHRKTNVSMLALTVACLDALEECMAACVYVGQAMGLILDY